MWANPKESSYVKFQWKKTEAFCLNKIIALENREMQITVIFFLISP